MEDTHYRKLENMYLNANINRRHFPSTKIGIEHEKAEITLEVDDSYHHALGGMHGSVYFKLLDDAAFFAVNSIVRDFFVLTTNFNLQFLRPFIVGNIRAEGKVLFASRSLFIAESKLYNKEGKIIGMGTGNFVKSKTALTQEIGYSI